MKTAIAYIRISDDEQSHFSIDGQQQHIREYCERHDIHLHQSFIDNGFSAKNFNRPAWKELKDLLKREKGKHSYLIVYKYDRMIRNAMEGLAQIYELESTHRLTIISVCENLGLNPHSPYFKKVRADILVNAEFERDVISHRVRFGMNHAMRSGRYLHQAPFGYRNGRDHQDHPILIIEPTEAEIVRQIFTEYLSGHPQAAIMQKAQKAGFNHRGKSYLQKILRNPLYAGMVRVTPFEGKPSELVPGQHKAIVTVTQWYAAQSKLEQKSIVFAPKITSEHLPLRGILQCHNGHVMTGCFCTGRSGQKFPYYKCNKCRQSHSATKAHEDIDQVLQAISLSPSVVKLYVSKVKQKIEAQKKNIREQEMVLRRQITDANRMIASAEDKFVRGSITEDSYQRMMQRYYVQIQNANEKLAAYNAMSEVDADAISSTMFQFSNLSNLYQKADVHQKQQLIRLLFPGGLIRLKTTYQTTRIMSGLSLSGRRDAPLQITSDPDSHTIPSGGPWEYEIKPLLDLIKTIRRA